jgi:hyperosmotically inducible protein
MKSLKSYIALGLAILSLSFASVNAQSSSARSIEDQVYKKILKLPRYEVFDHIAFKVDGGTVTLYGKVRNAINKSGAENSVERIPGVTNVVNNIEVLPLGSFDDSIRRNLYNQLSRTGALSRYLWTVNPSVRLIVDGGHISLEGYVANRGDYNMMNMVARGVPGAFSVANNLVINSERVR